MSDKHLRVVDGRDEPSLQEEADCNLRAARPMVHFLADRFGADEVERELDRLGLAGGDFEGPGRWVSLERCEAFFELVRAWVGSDEAFQQAASYRLGDDGFGVMRFLLYATTPLAVYERSARHAPAVLAHASYQVVSSTATSVTMRYRSDKPEGRLFCLLRQAQGAALPTIWRLPPAHLEERSCLADGDECCEYHIRWFLRPRWISDVVGALLGGAAAWGAVVLGGQLPSVWLVLPLMGALLGRLFETRRVNMLNTGVANEIQQALRETLREEAETRRELWALGARRSEWARLMEQAVNERTAATRELIERLERELHHGTNRVKGFTHDVRSPLTVLMADAELLRTHVTDPEAIEIVEAQLEAARRIDALLRQMVASLPDERAFVRLRPTRIDTTELTESIRRRLRALCYGRSLRTTVFATREAPEHVNQDPIGLNRVIDNLLTNAAKYTERGSIMVEVSGKPGELTLKISDTGRGIDEAIMEQVFQPGGSDPKHRAEHSSGIGLSVVVQLLDQVGGRLEVMSRAGVGTTFWVHVPIESPAPSTAVQEGGQAFARVVRIRPAVGQ